MPSPDTALNIELPADATLEAGSVSWHGDLVPDQPTSIAAVVRFKQPFRAKILCRALRRIDRDNAWGDLDAIYLTGTNQIGVRGFPIAMEGFVLPDAGEELLTADSFTSSRGVLVTPSAADPATRPTPPACNPSSTPTDRAAANNSLSVLATAGQLTVTGHWGYDDRTGTYVPAREFLVEIVRGDNAAHLAYCYTDLNGFYSCGPFTNPGTAGVKSYMRSYASYTPYSDVLAVVNPDYGTTNSVAFTFPTSSATKVLADGTQDIGSWKSPAGTDYNRAYWIQWDLNRTWRYIWFGAGSSRNPQETAGSGTVQWKLSSTDGTYYNSGGNIHLTGEDPLSDTTLGHEFGHNIMYSAYGFWFPTANCPNPHYINGASHVNCAWTEGWANFLALAVNNDPVFRWASGSSLNLETPTWGTPNWDSGEAVEGRVAGALWDILDSANDGSDQYSDGSIANIWDTLKHQTDNRFSEYWAAWQSRGHTVPGPLESIYQNTINYHSNYTLTVTGGGTGSGTVTGTGISCTISAGSASGTCSANYTSNTVVALTATPTGGSTFSGWGGSCAETGGCSVTMSASKSVSASFALPSYTLTVTGGGTGQGTVTGTGINCTVSSGGTSGTCSASYAAGTGVTLTATPTGGSTFSGWGGTCAGTGGCSITMNANKSASASFTGVTNYTLSVTGAGTGQGTVTGTGINCTIIAGSTSGTCSASYASGTGVSLTATPAGSSTFSGWSGNCSGTAGCSITMNATKSASASFTSLINTQIRNDFDGDRKADVFWRHPSGANAVWFMNGGTRASGLYAPSVDAGWIVAGTGDFNGDGKADLLWRNTTSGLVAVWLMNGAVMTSSASLNSLDGSWTVAGIGDFNGDGKDDILWRHSSGTNAIWFMNGTILSSGLYTAVLEPGWTVAAVGDFDGDHKADILWRQSSSGINAVWLMNGATRTSGTYVNTLEQAWTLIATGDFDGDGKADVLWRSTWGTNAIWFMNGGVIRQGAYTTLLDPSWTLVSAGDFNGDSKADVMWRHTDGLTAVWLMNGTAISGTYCPILDTAWIARPKPSTNGQ